jgi:hypothetical protein
MEMWSESNGLMALLGLGFLAAVVCARAMSRGSFTHGGILFFGLGVAIGPVGLGALDGSAIANLGPLFSVLVGWVGMLAGLAVTMRKDGGLIDGAVRTGLVYALVGVAAFGTASWVTLDLLFPAAVAGERILLATATVTAAALAASPRVVRLVGRRVHSDGAVTRSGESLARVVRVAAIATLAIAMAFHDRQAPTGLRDLAPTEWLLGELLLGLATGLVADAFIGNDPSDSRLVTTLAAVSLFTTGMAWQLGLTPLTLNLVVGLTLANFGQREAERHEPVLQFDTPLLYVLLVLVGAAWTLPNTHLAPLLGVGLVAVRMGVSSIAGTVAGRAIDPTSPGLRRLGLVTLGQGAVALAIALTYTTTAEPGAGQAVLTIVLISVLLNDFWAAPAARVVLDEAGEIPTLVPEV